MDVKITLLIASVLSFPSKMKRFKGKGKCRAVVSCHARLDVDVSGQVPRCAQSGTANCTMAGQLIDNESSQEEEEEQRAVGAQRNRKLRFPCL